MMYHLDYHKGIVIGKKHENINIKLENNEIEQVHSFRYLESILTEVMKCTKEIETRIAMAKETFKRKIQLLCGPINKNLRKRLAKCYVWRVALSGAET